ncbi:MAG TPA: hypothetical protein VLO11_07950, partial [Luteolibacter sp.]|nr:hypothetical protein [Luteolibacter sp.]
TGGNFSLRIQTGSPYQIAVTPAFDLTAATTATIAFDYKDEDGGSTRFLEVEFWNGSSWQLLQKISQTASYPDGRYSYTVTSGFSANSKFRFEGKNGGGGGTRSAYIDNLVITSDAIVSGNPYDTWAGGPWSGTLTDASADLDFDGGGLATGLEWVLGGDPTDGGDDASIAPTIDNTTDPDFFIFTYRRADEANADSNTTIAVEYGSDLGGWTTAVTGPDIVITPTENGAGTGIDLVAVKIRRTLAVGGKLFARLNVEVAE